MELKLLLLLQCFLLLQLLIVPYGIETGINSYSLSGKDLLIVPYGIETNLRWPCILPSLLLIVPYGIETC